MDLNSSCHHQVRSQLISTHTYSMHVEPIYSTKMKKSKWDSLNKQNKSTHKDNNKILAIIATTAWTQKKIVLTSTIVKKKIEKVWSTFTKRQWFTFKRNWKLSWDERSCSTQLLNKVNPNHWTFHTARYQLENSKKDKWCHTQL